MAEFFVDINQIKESSERIKKSSIRIYELGNDLEILRKNGIFYSSYESIVDNSIRGQLQSILKEAEKIDTMGEALQLIAERYSETEQLLLKNVSNSAVSEGNGNSVQPSESEEKESQKIIQEWEQKYREWLENPLLDEKNTTTKEQEEAADAEIRRKLRDILQDEKYSRWKWQFRSVEERKQLLQEYMNEAIKIYGLKDINPNIVWSNELPYGFLNTAKGGYVSTDNEYGFEPHNLVLNEQILTGFWKFPWSPYDLFATIGHELRHAYQHEAVTHPENFMVSQDTLDAWKKDFEHPLSTDEIYQGRYDEYLNRPTEIDARSFEISRH